MFAVPGWSVKASALKQQSEPQAQNQANQSQKPNADDNAKSNKRKRDDNVTKKNVDLMYRRHIEGSKDQSKPAKPNSAPPKPEKKPWERKREEKNGAAKQTQGQDTKEAEAPEATADGAAEEGKSSKKRRKNKNKNKGSQEQAGEETQEASTEAAATETVPAAPPPTAATLTPLQQAMRQKLISSRFRHLNETLYTTPSTEALQLFTANPELFEEYHAGFSRQVKESWPSNPVDGYISAIRTRGAIAAPKKGKPDQKARGLPLPRRPNGACTIVDLGCGDAKLHSTLLPSAKKLNLKLHSFDLHAPKGSPITKADIANLPLEDGSADIAIFCLSLMGTNWVSFVEEAWRVLRGDGKGECWVSEVKSRFGKVNRKKAQIGAKRTLTKAEKKKLKKKGDDDAGSDVDDADIFAEDARPSQDDETDISAFVDVFRTRGFVLKSETVDKSNKMFVKLEFVKAGGAPTKGKHASATTKAPAAGKKRFIEKPVSADNGLSPEDEARVLKPCVYKIR
ncbi:methyltransferase-domain-containing protein [Aspergillus multicolor]|uniref:25S rRNA (adenine645-N1)-methyltransferase n=1 Tax=Aspergillus multicolor TaxID=41759 RepID=UPI003CCE2334